MKWEHRVLGVLLLGSFFSPIHSLYAADFTLKTSQISGCSGGRQVIATFPFQDPSFQEKYDLIVVRDEFHSIAGMVTQLKKKGLTPVALINGGYIGGRKILSYYKSSYLGVESPSNSVMSPRACMVYDRRTHQLDVRLSTPENYKEFQKLEEVEIFCAGPQLVRQCANTAKQVSCVIARTSGCIEHFLPKCRYDHRDPGVNFFGSEPRSASCVTHDGALKFFSFNSNTHRCGIDLPQLAKIMIYEGCRVGLNHDGGASEKLYLDLGHGEKIHILGAGFDRKRLLPVWVAVIKKP